MKTEAETWASLEAFEQKWQEYGANLDAVQVVQIRSFLGRTLEQYESILGNPFSEAVKALPNSPKTTVVDVGCSAGVALMGLRNKLPKARLIGLDIRDATLFTLSNGEEGINLGEVFLTTKIKFMKSSYLQILTAVPDGYDLLTSVYSFLEEDNHPAVRTELLNRFYSGLKPGGNAFVYLEATRASLKQIKKSLKTRGIDCSFYQDEGTDQAEVSGTLHLTKPAN